MSERVLYRDYYKEYYNNAMSNYKDFLKEDTLIGEKKILESIKFYEPMRLMKCRILQQIQKKMLQEKNIGVYYHETKGLQLNKCELYVMHI